VRFIEPIAESNGSAAPCELGGKKEEGDRVPPSATGNTTTTEGGKERRGGNIGKGHLPTTVKGEQESGGGDPSCSRRKSINMKGEKEKKKTGRGAFCSVAVKKETNGGECQGDA